jgi:hypothetical protein
MVESKQVSRELKESLNLKETYTEISATSTREAEKYLLKAEIEFTLNGKLYSIGTLSQSPEYNQNILKSYKEIFKNNAGRTLFIDYFKGLEILPKSENQKPDLSVSAGKILSGFSRYLIENNIELPRKKVAVPQKNNGDTTVKTTEPIIKNNFKPVQASDNISAFSYEDYVKDLFPQKSFTDKIKGFFNKIFGHNLTTKELYNEKLHDINSAIVKTSGLGNSHKLWNAEQLGNEIYFHYTEKTMPEDRLDKYISSKKKLINRDGICPTDKISVTAYEDGNGFYDITYKISLRDVIEHLNPSSEQDLKNKVTAIKQTYQQWELDALERAAGKGASVTGFSIDKPLAEVAVQETKKILGDRELIFNSVIAFLEDKGLNKKDFVLKLSKNEQEISFKIKNPEIIQKFVLEGVDLQKEYIKQFHTSTKGRLLTDLNKMDIITDKSAGLSVTITLNENKKLSPHERYEIMNKINNCNKCASIAA